MLSINFSRQNSNLRARMHTPARGSRRALSNAPRVAEFGKILAQKRYATCSVKNGEKKSLRSRAPEDDT